MLKITMIKCVSANQCFAITSSNPTYEEGTHDKALRTSALGANAMIDQESRSMRV